MSRPPVIRQVRTVISPDAAFSGSAQVVNLDHERFKLSKQITPWVLALFGISTLVVMGLVVWLAKTDIGMIEQKLIKPNERLITENVIMTVIGATFVQLGTAAFLIVQSVFRFKPSEPSIDADES